MNSMTEESAMLEVKRGKLDMLSVLFESYQQRIYNFFMRMTYKPELSQDLTQNVFLRILKYRKSYKESKPFKAWIFQIARNTLNDHFNKKQLTKDEYVQLETIDDIDNSGEELKQTEEKEIKLRKAMALMKQQDRELLILSKFQKMKYEEIALITNYSVANVKVRIHRAISKLRELYFLMDKN